MELLFLGTGAGMPSKFRNTSSAILNLRNEGEGYWMFDCGEATQHQLLHTSVKPSKLNRIFITHLHGDHIFGLPGFLSSRSFLGGDTPLHVYGPAPLRAWLEETFRMSNTHLSYDLHFHPVTDGFEFETDRFRITARELHHVVPSYGYRIEERPQPGKLLIEEVKKRGVPNGPLLGKLKEGKSVTLHDGTIVRSEDVTAPPTNGRVVTILGDTAYCEASIALGRNADVLVHEATFDASTAEIARQYGHATIGEAALVAKRANARHLVANHISARFLTSDLDALQRQGEAVFQPITIVHDFDTIPVNASAEK